jgi:hypothetical protein
MSIVSKLLLTVSSLGPLLGALGVWTLSTHGDFTLGIAWIVGARSLSAMCPVFLRFLYSRSELFALQFTVLERERRDVLTYLVTSLVPFVTAGPASINWNTASGLYVIGVIILVVAQTDSFHINPSLSLAGYRVFVVSDGRSRHGILIYKGPDLGTGSAIHAARIADGIFLSIHHR